MLKLGDWVKIMDNNVPNYDYAMVIAFNSRCDGMVVNRLLRGWTIYNDNFMAYPNRINGIGFFVGKLGWYLGVSDFFYLSNLEIPETVIVLPNNTERVLRVPASIDLIIYVNNQLARIEELSEDKSKAWVEYV